MSTLARSCYRAMPLFLRLLDFEFYFYIFMFDSFHDWTSIDLITPSCHMHSFASSLLSTGPSVLYRSGISIWGKYIVKPRPQTPKPQTQKPKTKGPWADTKLRQATHPPTHHPPITFKHEGGVPQQYSKSKNILKWSSVLVQQKKIQLDS